MSERRPTHLDYAEEAESAERGEAWPQAAALWRKAVEACDDAERRGAYETAVARCESEIAVDEQLAGIARRALGVPTLEPRGLDRLDFHEVGVEALQQALRLAYRAGRDAERQRPPA